MVQLRHEANERIAVYRKAARIRVDPDTGEVRGLAQLHDQVCTFALTEASPSAASRGFCDIVSRGTWRNETLQSAVVGLIHAYHMHGEWISLMESLGELTRPNPVIAAGIMEAIGPARFWAQDQDTRLFDNPGSFATRMRMALPTNALIAQLVVRKDDPPLRNLETDEALYRALDRAAKAFAAPDRHMNKKKPIEQSGERIEEAQTLMRTLRTRRFEGTLTTAGIHVIDGLAFGLFSSLTPEERMNQTLYPPRAYVVSH